MYDRETGKPKGYGFCEYQDVETAQSALRNLNNTDFNGRPLRVGVAAGESNKDEMAGMQQALGGPVLEVSTMYLKHFFVNKHKVTVPIATEIALTINTKQSQQITNNRIVSTSWKKELFHHKETM